MAELYFYYGYYAKNLIVNINFVIYVLVLYKLAGSEISNKSYIYII